LATLRPDPSETPSPLQQSTPSTFNSNIYPALNEYGGYSTSLVSLFRFIPVPLFPGPFNLSINPKEGVNIRVVSRCDMIQEQWRRITIGGFWFGD
jgi:hypothetical protein